MEVLRLVSRETPLDCIACVILYKNPPWMIENVISSFLDTTMNVKLYIIDNSPTPLMNPVSPKLVGFLSFRRTESGLR